MKMSSYQYRKSHCGYKTLLRPSYLHNGISYTGKTTSLYWIRAQVAFVGQHEAFVLQGRSIDVPPVSQADPCHMSDTAVQMNSRRINIWWVCDQYENITQVIGLLICWMHVLTFCRYIKLSQRWWTLFNYKYLDRNIEWLYRICLGSLSPLIIPLRGVNKLTYDYHAIWYGVFMFSLVLVQLRSLTIPLMYTNHLIHNISVREIIQFIWRRCNIIVCGNMIYIYIYIYLHINTQVEFYL